MINSEPQVSAGRRYSLKEASEVLCVSQPSLRKYTREGSINYRYHVGTKRGYYLGSDILDFWYGRK